MSVSNHVQYMRTAAHGHQSNYQGKTAALRFEGDIEKRIQARVAKDHVRIREFFIDFDKLRKGTVGEAAVSTHQQSALTQIIIFPPPINRTDLSVFFKFRTCLGTLGLSLTEEETTELINRYSTKDNTGLINYRDFVNKVDQVFTEVMNPSEVIQNARTTAVFNEEEQEKMFNMMDALNKHVVANRILLKPGFQDFDRSQSMHITSQQFLRVMKNLNIMPPSDEMFELITRRYCDRGNTKEVNYFHFCKDVDRPEDMFPQYTAKKPTTQAFKKIGVRPKQVSTFFQEPTHDIDVINNRFTQAHVDISNDPTDVEDRLKAAVVMKRVRIEEFFRDFDKLRKGRVTRNQFKSILSSMNFTLTNDEFKALAQKYETQDPERFFRYTDFVANINSAFTLKGIDKNPTTRVAPVTQNDTLLARRKYLAGEHNQQEIEEVLEEYRTAIKNKRIHLKPVFQDFDITRNGHVTKDQFLRTLDLLRITAPQNIVQMVLRRYMDKGNVDEVNYVDFCQDIDGAEQLFGVGQGFNHSKEYFPKTQAFESQAEIIRNTPDDIDDVITRIRVLTKQQRIRISEFFRDFDRLRSGHITAAQFRIGLTMAKCPVSSQEFDHLINHFKAPKEGAHVCWRDFSERVDEIFTTKGLEKSVDIPVGEVRTNTVYGRREATEEERALVQTVVENFREVIRKNRLDAKSFFQDRDALRHFKVSPKIFRQVLNTLGFQISENEVNAVALVYGNEDNSIKYAEFLRDANCLEYVINGNTTGAKSTFRDKFTDFDGVQEHNDLMLKVKQIVKKDRIRLLEFFQDFDTLRKGYLPAQKFRSTLHAQRIQLTSGEYDKLEKHFALSNDNGLVNYVTFCEELDFIFTNKALEKNPTQRPDSFNAPSILDPKDVLNGEEEQVLIACLERLGVEVKHRRLLIKPHFQDKDRSRSGFIAFSRFRSIFDTFRLQVSAEEMTIIQKRFQAKAANEINYVEFDHVLRHYSGDHQPF